jgi:hypothetical protein
VLTQGELLLDAPYSIALRALVLRCLSTDWKRRPSARELLGAIKEALMVVGKEKEVNIADGMRDTTL